MTLRRGITLTFLFLATGLAATPGGAAESGNETTAKNIAPADLPPVDNVLRVLDSHPSVRMAMAELTAAQGRHDRLRAGDYEFDLTLAAQRRNVNGGPDYNEWSAGLLRGLRLPGKARLDERIGAVGVEEADERVGDARHEAARQLLSLWYGRLQAQAEARLWQAQVDSLAEERRIVETRVKRGDAARLDALQADAALAQASSQMQQARGRERTAAAELAARFPGLPEPSGEEVQPQLPAGGETDWVAHTLEHNHELLAVQRAVERGHLHVRRAERDRIPDPTVGLHFANEQGGDEKLLGLSLSIPLPGEARRAQTRIQLAQAQAETEREAATRRRLSAEAAANWQRAANGVEAWRRLGEAARAMDQHARLAGRAHELGELGLSEALLARRNAQETRLAAEQARLVANEAVARLLLDAHRLWPLGGSEEHH